jgi:AcrR family transcriptional regulator
MNARSPSETPIPTLRERIRQATAAAILEAAEQVFAEQGTDNVRMNDIAARAGVAVGTLYNHFADRETLLTGLMLKRKEELLVVLDEALEAGELDFRARLELVFAKFYDYMERHRAFYGFYAQCEINVNSAATFEMTREIFVRMEKLVKKGLREKVLRPEGAELYAVLLMGSIRALYLRERMTEKRIASADVREVLRCFLQGAGA